MERLSIRRGHDEVTMMENMAPTEKEKLMLRMFTLNYLTNGNKMVEAAKAAGYSESQAMDAGKLLRTKAAQAHIKQHLRNMMRKHTIDVERVMKEMACIALFDMEDVVDENGNILPLNLMPEDARRAISTLDSSALFAGKGKDKMGIGILSKLKFHSKMDALKELAKILQAYPDPKLKVEGDVKHEHTQKVSEIEIQERVKQLVQDRLGSLLD